MNHFHKHPIAHKEQAQLAHMNALHYCAVLEGGVAGIHCVFMTGNDTFSARFVWSDTVRDGEKTVQYLNVRRRSVILERLLANPVYHIPENKTMFCPVTKQRGGEAG